MSLDDIKDYLSEFKDISYETKRGLVILGIGLVAFAAPIGIMHHYDKLADQNNTLAKNHQVEASNIEKKATKELSYRKVQLKNQPQTQKHIESQVRDIIKAQKTILAYKRKDKKTTKNMYNDALVVMTKNLSSMDLLGDPEEGLFIDIDRNQDLDVEVSYQPSYSVKNKYIDIVFHYTHKGKELYTILAKYSLVDEKIVGVQYFTTNNAYFYEANDLHGTDKKSWLNRKKAWAESSRRQQEEAEDKKIKAKKDAQKKKKSIEKEHQKQHEAQKKLTKKENKKKVKK